MIFVDASAIISMITSEDDADLLADILETDIRRRCSALSVWESVSGLCRTYMFSVASAGAVVRDFLEVNEIEYVPIGKRECDLAANAYAEFGKGRHPAELNMGDCFAYACARANDARLLAKGNDFTKTDIAFAGHRP